MDALTIEDLTKTYANGVEALKSINFNVSEGDFFALLGPNGAGKTTAIGIVTSLVNKTSGRIEVFGHDIEKDLNAAKSCIAVVPQETNLNLFDGIFNILVNQAGFYGVSRRESLKRAEHYLRQMELWDKRKEMARSLSGGMKRRLMIARALVSEPKLLLLDEPTAGVDIETRRAMWNFLRQINRNGTTIILTTHYLEEAEQLCNQLAIIDDGKIVENDSMKNVLTKLKQEIFVLNLDRHIDENLEIENYLIEITNPKEIEVHVKQAQTLNPLFERLASLGIGVLSMRNKTNRLEELFVELTKTNSNIGVKTK
jgi:ABC-2 type transport system ATP-binding protein